MGLVQFIVFFILGSIQGTSSKVHLIHSSRFLEQQNQQQLVKELINMDEARLNYLFGYIPNRYEAGSSRSKFSEAHGKTGDDDDDILSSKLVSASYVGLGQYFVDFQIGTPSQKLLMIMDTGSDLIWVKCNNISSSSPQQVFTSQNSTSFSNILCTENACGLVPAPQSSRCALSGGPQVCDFIYSYNDASSAQGNLSRESVSIARMKHGNSTKSFKNFENVAFGCASQLQGRSFEGSAGVLGLGKGPLSFPSQVGLRTFSYCLVDYLASNASSSLAFGRNILPNKSIEYVPVLGSNTSFYYVGVTDVAVDGQKVRGINRSKAWHIDSEGNGGTIFDTGTTLTYLRQPAYSKIMTKLSSKIKLPRVDIQPLEFCYNISCSNNHEFMPELTIKFQGGAKLRLTARNYMVLQQEDVKCIAITRSRGFNIIGNLMQRNFHFEFHKNKMGFAWSPCS